LSKIIIVDDEVDNTPLFKMVLEDNGFVVDVFNDPTLVLANFKPGYYELIILDIRKCFISKPIEVDDFVNRILQVLNQP
jgi:CheY-like chemotaxis protein